MSALRGRGVLHSGLLCTAVLALAPLVIADGGMVRIEGELPANAWLAIRFNLTPDNDMTATGQVRALPMDESRVGGAVWTIQDGDAWLAYAGPAALATLPPNEVGHVATPVARVGIDLGGGTGSSVDVLPLGHGGFLHPNTSWAQVAIPRAESSKYWFNATWTRGVISWDAQTGPAIVEHRDEWGTGAHVGTYSFMGAASAGGLLSRELQTERDAVGWFLGDSDASWQESIWSCTHDGTACDSYGPVWFGAQKVISKGPTDWRFSVDATVEVGSPSITLLVAELPGDDYLR